MDPNRSVDSGSEDLIDKSRPGTSREWTADKLWSRFLNAFLKCIPIWGVADDGIPLAVPADPPEEDGDETQSLKKRYARNKMDPASTCVDSALESLARCDELHWTPIRLGLDFFRTCLTVVPQWSVAGDGVHELLGKIASIARFFGSLLVF